MLKLKKRFLSSMVKESKHGVTGPSIMVTGGMEWPRVKVLFIMLTVMCIQESFSKIELMGSEFMFILTGRDMKDSGKMTTRMGLEKRSLKMGQNMTVCLRMEKSGDKEHTNGLMRAST